MVLVNYKELPNVKPFRFSKKTGGVAGRKFGIAALLKQKKGENIFEDTIFSDDYNSSIEDLSQEIVERSRRSNQGLEDLEFEYIESTNDDIVFSRDRARRAPKRRARFEDIPEEYRFQVQDLYDRLRIIFTPRITSFTFTPMQLAAPYQMRANYPYAPGRANQAIFFNTDIPLTGANAVINDRNREDRITRNQASRVQSIRQMLQDTGSIQANGTIIGEHRYVSDGYAPEGGFNQPIDWSFTFQADLHGPGRFNPNTNIFYYDRQFVIDISNASLPQGSFTNITGPIGQGYSIIFKSEFVRALESLAQRIGWNPSIIEMWYQFEQRIGTAAFIVVRVNQMNAAAFNQINNGRLPSFRARRPRDLADVKYLSSDFSNAVFNEAATSIVEFFETPNHKARVEAFGNDGCIKDVMANPIRIENLLNNLSEKVKERNNCSISIFNEMREEFGDEEEEFHPSIAQLEKFFSEKNYSWEIIDQNNYVLSTGRSTSSSRSTPFFAAVYFDGHLAPIDNMKSFSKTNMKQLKTEEDPNRPVKRKFKSVLDNSIIDFIEDYPEGDKAITQLIKANLENDRECTYKLPTEKFNQLLNSFINAGKVPQFIHSDKKIVCFYFYFANFKKRVKFVLAEEQKSYDIMGFSSTIEDFIFDSSIVSHFSDSMMEFIDFRKGAFIYEGFIRNKEDDLIKLDINGAYRHCFETVLNTFSLPIFTSFDEVDYWCGGEIQDSTLYAVDFNPRNSEFPVHDTLIYGYYLKQINISYKIRFQCRPSMYVPKEYIHRITKVMSDYSSLKVTNNREYKFIINSLLGKIEKVNYKKYSYFTSTCKEEIEDLATMYGSRVYEENFGDHIIYSTRKQQIAGKYQNSLFPWKIAVYNQHLLNLIKYFNILRDNNIPVFCFKTDSIGIRRRDLENVENLKLISKYDGGLKLEDSEPIYYQFQRNEIDFDKFSPPLREFPSKVIQCHPDEIDFSQRIIAISGAAGSGKTHKWVSTLPKEDVIVLTLENINSKQWKSKGYEACTYHAYFGLSVAGNSSKKKEFSQRFVIFEEFSKISINHKYTIYKTMEKSNKTFIATYDLNQLEPIGIESMINREWYTSTVTNIHSRMFEVQYQLTSNFRAVNQNEFDRRENLREFFLHFDHFYNKLFAKEEIIAELRKYYTFKELSSQLELSENDIVTTYTNYGSAKVRDAVTFKGEKQFVPGCEVYFKNRITIGNETHYSGETYTFIGEKKDEFGRTLYTLDKDGVTVDTDDVNRVMLPQIKTGHILQGQTVKGKLYVYLDTIHCFTHSSWLYQAITRTNRDEDIIFLL